MDRYHKMENFSWPRGCLHGIRRFIGGAGRSDEWAWEVMAVCLTKC